MVAHKVLTNEELIMRSLANLILIFSLIVTTSNTSMQMFSIEKGKVFTESYNISHLLSSSSNIPCKNLGLNSNSFCNHSHVVVLNKTLRDDSDIVRSCIKQVSVVFDSYTFDVNNFLRPSMVLSDHSNLKFRLFQLPIALRNTPLLI